MAELQVLKRVDAQGDGQASSKGETSRVTRTKLLEAALECLHDLGYAETGLANVLERAGLGRGALAYHFPNKTDLMAVALSYAVRKSTAAFTAYANENDLEKIPLRERIFAYRRIRQKHHFAIAELSMALRTNAEMRARFMEEMNDAPSPPFAKIFPEICDPSQPRNRCNLLGHIVTGVEDVKIFASAKLADELFDLHCSDLELLVSLERHPAQTSYNSMLY